MDDFAPPSFSAIDQDYPMDGQMNVGGGFRLKEIRSITELKIYLQFFN